MSNRLVVLLREESTEDPYRQEFEGRGYSLRYQPVLAYRAIHREQLRARLRHADDYAGMILTSPRAAHAIKELGEDVRGWRNSPVFVVGPATADAVRELGLSAHGESSGDGAALADYIIQVRPAGPLLFLSGTLRREVLPDRLSSAGIEVDELHVYETIVGQANVDLEGAKWVTFFSPSGVTASGAGAEGIWNRLRLAAIGPTTAEALTSIGLVPHAVAAEPTPQALAQAILESDSHDA